MYKAETPIVIDTLSQHIEGVLAADVDDIDGEIAVRDNETGRTLRLYGHMLCVERTANNILYFHQ